MSLKLRRGFEKAGTAACGEGPGFAQEAMGATPSGFFSTPTGSSSEDEESSETRRMLGWPELKDMFFVGSFTLRR
jgi:hypothetical protein